MSSEGSVANRTIYGDENNVCELNKQIKLLSFTLDDQEYAVEAVSTLEILRLVTVIPVPEAPDFIPGIINLRGKIIPILDLRLRLGFPHKYYNLNTPIIIATNGSYVIGMIVDQVKEVFNIASANITPEQIMPGARYLKGVAKHESRLLLIINLKNLLNDSEKKSLQSSINVRTKDAAKIYSTG